MSAMVLGAIIVSVANSIAFFAALAFAYWKGDTTSISLLVGAVVANASTVVSFWLGSSADSSRKTELMAAQQKQP